jgi:uncharacterized membrane protein YkoI
MRTLWLSFILLGGLALHPAFADDVQNQPEQKKEHSSHRSDGHLNSNEAARIAQKQEGGGRVLAVELTDEGYRVKLLKKGEVHIVIVPSP